MQGPGRPYGERVLALCVRDPFILSVYSIRPPFAPHSSSIHLLHDSSLFFPHLFPILPHPISPSLIFSVFQPPTPPTHTHLNPTNTHPSAALGLCVEPRLRDWPAALGHAKRLAELRKTPQRQADVQLFEHLVESGSKTAVVSYSKATGTYQVGIVGEAGGGGGAAAGPSFHLRSPSTGSNKSGKGKTGSQKIDGPQKLPPLSAV